MHRDERCGSTAGIAFGRRLGDRLDARQASREQITGSPPGLADSIQQTNPVAYQVARRVQAMPELDGAKPTDAEVVCLAVHVARLEESGGR